MPTYNDKTKQAAYDVIKYLYKNMPHYNQLKGTYAGIQMILNLMGLCASITELWSDRAPTSLMNFTDDDHLYRADYLNSVRQRIEEWGNANVKDFFLTSRFDADIVQTKDMNFRTINGMASTIIDTILQMKPVTRCLRYLRFILRVNTDIHFEYITDFAAARADIDTFRYTWDLVNHPLAYKSIVDKRAGNIYGLFIPWLSVDAERVCHITADETDTTVTNTFKNTYFNLFEIDHRLDISKQRTLRFRIEGSFKNKEYDPEVYALEYKLEISKDVIITTEQNGFMINFKGPAVTILSDLFDKFNQENIITEDGTADVYDELLDNLIIPETAINMYDDYNNTHLTDGSIQLKFIASFSTAIGTKYLYQDDEIPLDPDEDFDPNVYVVIPGDSADDPIYTLDDPVDTDNPTYIVYNQ